MTPVHQHQILIHRLVGYMEGVAGGLRSYGGHDPETLARCADGLERMAADVFRQMNEIDDSLQDPKP